jgi:hypothetical protein
MKKLAIRKYDEMASLRNKLLPTQKQIDIPVLNQGNLQTL